MNFKRSSFSIQDKNSKDLDNTKEYPTLTDLNGKENASKDEVFTVHKRRDLDSLG